MVALDEILIPTLRGRGEDGRDPKTNTDKEEQHDKHRDKVMCNKESNEGGEESEQ